LWEKSWEIRDEYCGGINRTHQGFNFEHYAMPGAQLILIRSRDSEASHRIEGT